jgi:hypothetical protein
VTPDDEGPSFARMSIVCGVTWAAAVVGVVLAIVRDDWLIAAWAANASTCAAGWYMAARRWSAWRSLALRLAYRIGQGD